MDVRVGANRVGDRWQAAASGHAFEVPGLLAPYGPRGRWPRSAETDVREALEQARSAERAWGRLERAQRLELLLRALGRLEETGLERALAPGLGRDAARLRGLVQEDLLRGREALELLREGGGRPSPGTGLFQAHWSDLVGTLLARLGLRLLAGSAAVVLADPRLPEAADALAAALAETGLPPGVVNVLHDDGRSALRAALQRPGLAWVRLREARGRLAEVVPAADARDGFAAGLTEWSPWPLESALLVVRRADDPVEAARAVAERGLSPTATLSGQLPGSIGRVLCHERVLSRLTEELLALLDACGELAEEVPLVEPDLFQWMREAWSLGLDEGAAPIFGAAPGDGARRAQPRDDGAPPAELRGRPPRAVRPTVFTNVEAGGRLLELERPAPLLRLVRVASDDEALRLRRALESAPPPNPRTMSRSP